MLIQKIALTTQLTEQDICHLAESADRRYKVYSIPKRGVGLRKIEHPSREIKALQKWIVKVVIDRFPIHPCATAYRKGGGIKLNAERHRSSKYTNRYDFSNFFPSFTQENVEQFLSSRAKKSDIQLGADDIRFIGNIVCRHGRLTIGAPSSPALTNAMMFDFDKKLFGFCKTKKLIYSRYADDLFISSTEKGKLTGLENQIKKANREIKHLSLKLNSKKTTYLSKKYARRITGVVITPDHKLSIGRNRKRELKALVHLWVNHKLEIEKINYMRGWIAFARDIEPEFENSLRTKYGNDPIDQILKDPDLSNFID